MRRPNIVEFGAALGVIFGVMTLFIKFTIDYWDWYLFMLGCVLIAPWVAMSFDSHGPGGDG